jgi:tetratricopeptide (TPR) repeat protein
MIYPELLRAAARCWERAGHFAHAAERYAQAGAWADAGRCWARAGRTVDAAGAYARAGEPIGEARQWLASPWPERARRPYRQALETGLAAPAEVEALLGLGEIERASERAFAAAPGNGRSVDALRSLARIAAARGRPDLAARAWERAIASNPAAARDAFAEWEQAAPWNRSLNWGRPQAGAPGWPSREFRDVRLELVWEEKLGEMMYGNRGLAWSADGRRFAAATYYGALVLGTLTDAARYQRVEMRAISVAFMPESESVLVGCEGGQVMRVDALGAQEELEALKMPNEVWEIAFSPRGDRVAIAGWTSPGSLLRIFAWESRHPRALVKEERAQQNKANPCCAWSPDGSTLAWCPGPWSEDTAPNDLYLLCDASKRCVASAHENGVNGVAFTPEGKHLVTASLDRTLVLRDPHTGQPVASPWTCMQRPAAVVIHPQVALIGGGGLWNLNGGEEPPSCLYLLRFSHADSLRLEVIQEKTTETAVASLAFSPDGEHLLMSTDKSLSLFRVHLS